LEKEIYYFVALIVAIMVFMIILVVIVWYDCLNPLLFKSLTSYFRATYLRKAHPDWINVPTLIVDCVSVAVAFIPEGLPIAVTARFVMPSTFTRKHVDSDPQSHHHCQSHEAEQDPVQVAEDCRDPGLSQCHLFG
jgi:sodium/potassium-transporting ATPase subunit alpha